MIRSVTSSLPTFKTIRFGQGLNILLADVADTSTERHTRNSAGKTSLVEIVHFVLGSDAGKSSIFKHEALIEHSFSLEVLLDQRWIRATRSGAADDTIFVSAGDARALGFEVPLSLFDLDEADDVPLGIEAWKALLGQAWFKLPADRSDGEFQDKGAPTFRQLIGYFARRRKIGGLDTIERTSRDQQPGNWQVALSYLLGLNWHVARRFQDMRDRRKSLQALSKAVKSGELGEILGTTAEIRPELARVEDRVKQLRAQVDAFQVHDSYRELAHQAASLKDEISEATFSLAEANSAIDYLTKSLEQEGSADDANVEALYAAAGVELPNVALRRFEDVKAFQASVTANRRHYLEEQIAGLETQRQTSSSVLATASAARTEILCALDGKGAFEDLMRLAQGSAGHHPAGGELVAEERDRMGAERQADRAVVLHDLLAVAHRDQLDRRLGRLRPQPPRARCVSAPGRRRSCAASGRMRHLSRSPSSTVRDGRRRRDSTRQRGSAGAVHRLPWWRPRASPRNRSPAGSRSAATSREPSSRRVASPSPSR